MCQQRLSDDDIWRIVFWSLNSLRLPKSISEEDLVQEGWIAALEAHKTYDPSKGTKLSSWVVVCVKGRLRNHIYLEMKGNKVASIDELSIEARQQVALSDRIDYSSFLSMLKKILSPASHTVLLLQLSRFPRRMRKEDITRILRISILDLDNLYQEMKGAVKSLKGYLAA